MSIKYRHYQDILVADVNDLIDFIIFISEQSSGVTDYNELENKPKINNVELSGDKTNTDLGIELKITTGVTTYTSGVVAPTITVNDFNSILSTDAPTITIVAHDANNKTHNYKVSYKSTIGIENKPTFQLTGIENSRVINYVYYLNTNSTVAVKIIQDIANIYRHYYTIRPSSAFVYETISFTIDLPTPTPLTTNTLRNWFTVSPFWDTTLANYIGKALYPCSGIAAISNNIPQVANGLCYYIEQDGMLINVTLYCYCNYGAVYSIDENTLHCSGVEILTNGGWE